MWYEYSAPSMDAIDFYGELFDWEIREEDGYFIAVEDGAPFLGMFVGEHAQWFSYFGVRDVDAACTQVENLGGGVEFGPENGTAGVHDANGAQFFLAEVDDPTFDEVDEADSVLG